MIPLSEISYCDPQDLKVGEIAKILGTSTQFLVVGELRGGKAVARFFVGREAEYNFTALENVTGLAMRLERAEIEVDWGAACADGDNEELLNALIVSGNEMQIAALDRGRMYPIKIGEGASGVPTGRSAIFKKWRIVVPVGNERRSVYEQTS